MQRTLPNHYQSALVRFHRFLLPHVLLEPPHTLYSPSTGHLPLKRVLPPNERLFLTLCAIPLLTRPLCVHFGLLDRCAADPSSSSNTYSHLQLHDTV